VNLHTSATASMRASRSLTVSMATPVRVPSRW
jgi:hypothetical protein